MGVSNLLALAEAIHQARWPADRQMAVTPFADEDTNAREYCMRIARAVQGLAIKQCAEVIGNMRQSEAGLFDAKHSGQRGADRSDALYDAYQAVMALAKESGQ